MSAAQNHLPAPAYTRDEPATWREIESRVARLRAELERAENAPVLAPVPGVETIVSQVLVRPRLLEGFDVAEFIEKNREHLQAYYDAQCALAEDDEVLPTFIDWAACQFDLACEFRARLRDECAGQ